MTSGSRFARLGPRQELWAVLLLGLCGAGLVLLSMRQGWGQVTTAAPRPLPAGSVSVTGQELVPAADALAVAALASLAAVLATRRLLRRITGIVLAGLGAGVAVAVSAGISAADVLGAAAGSAGPSTGSGAGTAPGSVTSGGTRAGSGAPLTGFAGHATLAAFPWRGAALAGALLLVAAGVLVAWRADRLPVMSSRYERPARPGGAGAGGSGAGGSGAGGAGTGGQATVAAGHRQPTEAAEVAALWESLSRGEDPTGQAGTGR